MPVEEMVLTILLMAGLFVGVLALTSMVLSHRRQMAAIKHEPKPDQTLSHENIELRETVEILQDRLAVLEQIATDPARRTAEEIERLR